MNITIYSGSQDWSALYVDGELDTVGDHYRIDERLRTLVGAIDIASDDFMRGGDDRDSVAPTLEALEAYVQETRRADVERELQELDAKRKELDARREELLAQEKKDS